MKLRHWLFLFLTILTGLRLLYGAFNPLFPDEAYYSMWAQRLDWSYFSKGPGVALIIRAGTALFGMNEQGIRFFSPLFGLGTSLVMFFLARRLYGESVGIWTVVAMNTIPIFQVGGVIMTIDPVSVFFWASALLTFWMALEKSPEFSFYWPLTGLLIGAGFLAKYTNAVELISILLILALTPRYRREFARPGFYLMLIVFFLCTLPVVFWNQQHEWITFFHLKARGGLDHPTGFHPTEFLVDLGMHLGVYSPLSFIGFMVALWWAWGESSLRESPSKLISSLQMGQSKTHFKARFLLYFSLPLLVMYFLLAFKKAGEPNWTGPAFVSLLILATAFWHQKAKESPGARRFVIAALVLGMVMGLLILNTEAVRALGIPWPYGMDPGARMRGWETAAQKVEAVRKQFEAETGKPAFLIGNSYGTCASIAFYMKDKRIEGPNHPPIYIPESQNLENQFSFWPRYDEISDYRQIAADFLATPEVSGTQGTPGTDGTPAGARKALADALHELPADDSKEDPTASEAAWHRFLQALEVAVPSLPIVEYASEEHGTNFFLGRNALYITDRSEERPPTSIKSGFERTELIGLFDVKRRNQTLRQVRVFACYSYRSVPL
jgi:4-amino-4-deoxy-L-arabinose transferase-like glycosyltransferase